MVFMMFVSGIFWDIRDITNTEAVDALLTWNPVAFLLHSYRQVLLWQEVPDGMHLLNLGAVAVIGVVIVLRFMQRYSAHLARLVVSA
jgi:lipopolysaccharide transport system permease protein